MRRLELIVLAVLASVLFVVLARAIGLPWMVELDRATELAVHRHLDSAAGDAWAATASFLGMNVMVLAAVVAVAGLALVRRRRIVAAIVVVDAALVLVADVVLKLVFARERPALFEKIARPTDYSFPSGHAMTAMGIWGVIAAVLCVLYPRARRTVIAIAVPVIASIGLSRIYFGVHWPFDVLGGFLAGIPPLAASMHLLRDDSARASAQARTRGEGAHVASQTPGDR